MLHIYSSEFIHKCSYSCSKYQCYSSYKISIYSLHLQFQVTRNKNIHTYSSLCIVVVHSDVHLSSSVPSFSLFFFPFSIYSHLTMGGRCNSVSILHEGFFWYASHFKITWMEIKHYNFDSCTHICIMIRQMVICTMSKYPLIFLEFKLRSKLKLTIMCA